MELSSHEGEIPMPLNSSFGHGHDHGHIIHHDHDHHHNPIPPQGQIIPSSPPQLPSNNNINGPSSNSCLDDDNHHHHHATATAGLKKMVKYKECLKNHAAAMGGNATDGCGEFMPGGEEGTIEALTCSACNCHRNFHRKEMQGTANNNETNPFDYYLNRVGRKLIVGYPTGKGTLVSSIAPPPQYHHQMIMPYNMGGSLPSESDEQEDGSGGGGGVGVMARPYQNLVKKRFRTKFSQEQKEKMLQFAEKIGWKMQKQEENVVQEFCQEIGVKRRVLKVWMHNNKHNLAKKNPFISITATPPTTTTTTTSTA